MRRVNAYLDPVTVDYERDVLPLTPAGNATERHMVLAYVRAAERRIGELRGTQGNSAEVASFWASKLGLQPAQVVALLAEPAKFQNAVRTRLMKRGGVGYVEPSHDAFPRVEEFHQLDHRLRRAALRHLAGWHVGRRAGHRGTAGPA